MAEFPELKEQWDLRMEPKIVGEKRSEGREEEDLLKTLNSSPIFREKGAKSPWFWTDAVWVIEGNVRQPHVSCQLKKGKVWLGNEREILTGVLRFQKSPLKLLSGKDEKRSVPGRDGDSDLEG